MLLIAGMSKFCADYEQFLDTLSADTDFIVLCTKSLKLLNYAMCDGLGAHPVRTNFRVADSKSPSCSDVCVVKKCYVRHAMTRAEELRMLCSSQCTYVFT